MPGWNLPGCTGDAGASDFLTWRLSEERVRALFGYACRHRATVTQVLLAALAVAVGATVPQPTGGPRRVNTAVDLRRYLPSKRAPAPCNLIGLSVLGVDAAAPLEGVLGQVRDQLHAQRQGQLGLLGSTLILETFPVFRQLWGAIPYRLLQWLVGRRLARMRQDPGTGRLLLTDVGEVEPERLNFAGTGPVDAFVTSGRMRVTSFLTLFVSGFQGTLTLTLGYGPAALIREVSDQLMQTLPA